MVVFFVVPEKRARTVFPTRTVLSSYIIKVAAGEYNLHRAEADCIIANRVPSAHKNKYIQSDLPNMLTYILCFNYPCIY